MVNLHNHSHYSFLDGLSSIEGMVARAKLLDQPALALTDHANICGAIPFYKECKKQRIKPIIGCEIYITRDYALKGQSWGLNAHLLLLARNNTGYHNLIKTVSEAYEHFYYRPRLTLEDLAKYSEGLICTSACLSSPFREWLMGESFDDPWRDTCEGLIDVFGEHFFFETQTYEAQGQYDYNTLIRAQGKRNRPVIVTSDCHYSRPEDFKSHDVLLAIQTGKDYDDPNRMSHACNTLYLHGEEELLKLGFPQEEIENTHMIADLCNVELDFSTKFPEVPNALETIKTVCEYRLQDLDRGVQKYRDRMEEELRIIQSCGFPEYFVILAEIVNWARDQGIRVGPARGSAAGSLVCRYLGITEVDPIKYDLMFYRFLNPDRIGLPDIDVDFEDTRREDVIEHIIDQYGREAVSNICTFQRRGTKQAFKDVARTMKIPHGESIEFSKMIPDGDASLTEVKESDPVLAKKCDSIGITSEMESFINSLIGSPRQPSKHAAGMVMAPGKITDYIPTMKIKEDVVTMYDMRSVEDSGLVKFDILGLNTLRLVSDAIDLIVEGGGERHNGGPDVLRAEVEEQIRQYDDPAVFKMIAEGSTVGCFQIETVGCTNLCRRLKTEKFEDIVHVVSLYRPAVLHTPMLGQYIENRKNPEDMDFVHPSLKKYLSATYGIMLFQEQQMQMTMDVASFSPSEADQLRKGAAKKIPELVRELGNKFLDQARENGHKNAGAMWDLLKKAGYGFNRAHAVSYSMITYWTACLKCHYPLEFHCALLNSEDKDDKLQVYVSATKKAGIRFAELDINTALHNHTIDGDTIVPGFKAIKGIGDMSSLSIIEERERGGPYLSVEDFLSRQDYSVIDKAVLIALIKSGAMDFLGHRRTDLLLVNTEGEYYICETMDKLRASYNLSKKHVGQTSLFDMQEVQKIDLGIVYETEPEDEIFLRLTEKEVLGFNFEDPLYKMEDIIRENTVTGIEEIEETDPKKSIRVVGVIEDSKFLKTRRGGDIARFTLRTLDDKIPVIVFGSNIFENRDEIYEGNLVVLSAIPNFYRGDTGLQATIIKPADEGNILL
ncbi:MAG: DNA polymerase III subunit alpha [Candidatus Thorarchaeota archaeon]